MGTIIIFLIIATIISSLIGLFSNKKQQKQFDKWVTAIIILIGLIIGLFM